MVVSPNSRLESNKEEEKKVEGLVPEEVGVGGARHEPEELLGDAAPEDALGREQRERLPQVEPQRAPVVPRRARI